MTSHTLTAPSYWVSYLINGDASDMEAGDLDACRNWLRNVGMGLPVTCEDAGYMAQHDASEHFDLAADCQVYTFLRK